MPGIAGGGVPPRRAGGRGGHGRDRLGGRRHPGVGVRAGGVSRVDLTHAAAGPFAEHKVDGRALTVSVSDATAVAVEGGALAFALELSRAVGHEVGVTWSTADGTAVSGG